TSKLTLAGDLTIEANSKAQTSVKVLPKGSIFVDPQDYSESLPHFVDNFPVNVTEDEVLVNGSGNLTIKSKSDEAKVEITAKPLKFNSTGTSQIFATGTESQINVDYPGSPAGQNSLIFNAGGVTFDTSNPNGDAGDINILADKVRNAADAVVTLKANAESNGKGGNITISMDRGTLALGSEAEGMSLSATGNGGNGGNVTIMNDVHNGRITYQSLATAPAIDVSALGSDGDGGTITLHSDILSDDGTVAVAALQFAEPDSTFVLSGAGSGKGGKLSSNQKIFTFSGKAIAPAGPAGEGGEIEIVATQAISLGSETKIAELTANGFGNGKGGSIKITTPAETAVDLSKTKISAKGSGSGEGGTVWVTKATGEPLKPLDVLEVIEVDGGTNNTGKHGEIKLNDVTCQQWKTGFAWPTSYWDCAGENHSSAPEISAAEFGSTLNGSLHAQMSDPNTKTVRLFVFENNEKFNDFFHHVATNDAAGATFLGPSHANLYVSVMLKVQGTSQSVEGVKEAAAHELGHAIDHTSSPPFQSAPTQYANYGLYAGNDLLYLDYAKVDLIDWSQSVRRDPCNPTPIPGQAPIPGPFFGLADPSTGQEYCDFDFAQNKYVLVNQSYAGHQNSYILYSTASAGQDEGPGEYFFRINPANPDNLYPGGFDELYAQTFAYRAYLAGVVNPSNSNVPYANLFLSNGWFACTQSWAAQVALGGTSSAPASPPASSGVSETPRACNTALPLLYQVGQ
nr:hypothetical protein [Candidatus Obscuribacter sp.]